MTWPLMGMTSCDLGYRVNGVAVTASARSQPAVVTMGAHGHPDWGGEERARTQ